MGTYGEAAESKQILVPTQNVIYTKIVGYYVHFKEKISPDRISILPQAKSFYFRAELFGGQDVRIGPQLTPSDAVSFSARRLGFGNQ